jgi:hypothetical protein
MQLGAQLIFLCSRSSRSLRDHLHRAVAIFIFIAPSRFSSSAFAFCSSSYAHDCRAGRAISSSFAHANLFCRIQRALILPLTLILFSLPAAEVALIVAPSRYS